MVTVDIIGAFDRVWLSDLIENFCGKGVEEVLLKLLKEGFKEGLWEG